MRKNQEGEKKEMSLPFIKNKKARKAWDFFESLIVAFILAMILRQFVIASYKIPTGSMENTLLVGDFLLGTKFNWGAPIPFSYHKFPALSEVQRNDIVIFRSPQPPYLEYIKRCVAMPGDVVEIRDKRLYIDGVFQPLPPGGQNSDFSFYEIRDNFGPVVVPVVGDTMRADSQDFLMFVFFQNLFKQENPRSNIVVERYFVVDSIKSKTYNFRTMNNKEVRIEQFDFDTLQWTLASSLINLIRRDSGDSTAHIHQVMFVDGERVDEFVVESDVYFVLGDNRDASQDSRFWGFVSQRKVLARPLLIYFSKDDGVVGSFLSRIRFERLGTLIR